MSESLILLAKVAAPLTAKAAAGGIRSLARTFVVAWRTRRLSAKREQLRLHFWKIRKFLRSTDVLGAFASGSAERLNELVIAIQAFGLGPSSPLSAAQSEAVLAVLLSAYTHHMAGNEATEIQVRTAVAEIRALFDERVDRNAAAGFDAARGSLPPTLREPALALRNTWPSIERFVIEYAASQDPRQTVKDWLEARPGWMSPTPASALIWLAGLAEEYGHGSLAARLIAEALEQGASPATFWRVRHALMTGGSTVESQRGAMQPYAGEHVAADAILTFLESGEGDALSGTRALAVLDTWEVRTAPEKYFKAFLACHFHAAAGNYDAATALAEDALTSGEWAPALFLAERLLLRGMPRTSSVHYTQIETALTLAIRVRNKLRGWHGPSEKAVLTAIKAAQLLGDGARALALAELHPRGDASPEEASSIPIRQQALLLIAGLRDVDDAEQLVANAPSTLRKAEPLALLAERRGDAASAIQHWEEALQTLDDPEDIFRVAFQLTRHGVYAEQMDRLEVEFPAEVEEMRLLAGLNAGTPGDLEAVRTKARQRKGLAYGLINYLKKSGELRQAARVAADGGLRWSDAEMWFIAARCYYMEAEYADAVDAARQALRTARSQWDDLADAHLLLIEALTGLGHWAEAADAAATALARFPGNASACWALVLCQFHLGQKADAWQTFSEFGGRPSPRNETEASAYIRLAAEFDSSDDALNTLLAVAEDWGTSKQVKLACAHVFLFVRPEVPEQAEEQVRELMSAIFSELDDVFVPQHFDEEDPVTFVNQMVQALPDTSDADRQVVDGTLPFGMLASIHHRTFAEALATRVTPLFASDPTRFDEEVTVAQGARGGNVVLDATSVFTLGRFDDSQSALLSGYVNVLRAPLKQRLDAVNAAESLQSRSTMTVGRSADGTAIVTKISEEEATARHRKVLDAIARYDSIQIVERTWQPRIPELADHLDDFIWAEALDLARGESPDVLWCDDVRVRQLAVAVGVRAFSTEALIEAMRRDGLLPDDVAAHLTALLVTFGLVGAQFELQVATAAADLERWKPLGTAAFLAWGPPPERPEVRLQFAADAIRRNLDDPDAMRSWAEATALWLVRAGGDENAEGNLVVFLRTVLTQAWLRAEALPFIVQGMRAVTRSRDLADPFEGALREHYQKLTGIIEHRMAYDVMRGLVVFMDAEDRSVLTRIAFSSR
ncbi:PIN domain-containing protein [Microbacterium sp.]|uniref:tetratricopeptide repeat protein n=1 Tax=Microbacterium sp. TaxID=51671 RepID=UPI003A920056